MLFEVVVMPRISEDGFLLRNDFALSPREGRLTLVGRSPRNETFHGVHCRAAIFAASSTAALLAPRLAMPLPAMS